ncbi:MAG: hypothetical protein ACRKGH_06775 [Dehalogenimonas sp.]
MTGETNQNTEIMQSAAAAVNRLRMAIESGQHWYPALLEAAGYWPDDECIDGRVFRYLIAGEAFDFLLLAERLSGSLPDLIPEAEQIDLLFNSRPPMDVTAAEMRQLMGAKRYQQHLNYFYGITVEEALILAIQDEIRKEERSLVIKGYDTIDESFIRLYEQSRPELLKLFRRDRGERPNRSLKLPEMREFTYWLFKFRLRHTDKARVASDTKKALNRLKNFPGKNDGPGLEALSGI